MILLNTIQFLYLFVGLCNIGCALVRVLPSLSCGRRISFSRVTFSPSNTCIIFRILFVNRSPEKMRRHAKCIVQNNV